MKCAKHPKTDAIEQCSECGSFLCDACVASEDSEKILCEGCMMLSTLSAMTDRKIGAKERQIQKKTKDEEKKEKRRRARLIIAAAIAICIAIIELLWNYSISPKQTNEFVPSENIILASTIINDAIIKYREKHEGIVPDSLDNLMGDYLPEDFRWRTILFDYTYLKITPYKYELIPPITEKDTLPDIIFTDEGVKTWGMG